eukprot:31427-Pelagococcus_subviridis.AAC.11
MGRTSYDALHPPKRVVSGLDRRTWCSAATASDDVVVARTSARRTRRRIAPCTSTCPDDDDDSRAPGRWRTEGTRTE